MNKTIVLNRWYANPEIWLNVASGISSLASMAAAGLNTLGLSPSSLFFWSLAIALLVNVANIVVKMTTKYVVASAKTITAVASMPNTDTVVTDTANAKGTAATIDLHPDGR